MEFYNFEKYNDPFCFEKLSQDYQPLLRIYQDNFNNSLNEFLKEYEENTELRFIESQLYFCNKEINVQKSIVTSLEKIDLETFYYVRNRIGEKYCVYEKIQSDPFDNKTTHKKPNKNNDDDDYFLNTHATAKNFIKFISNRITSLCLINEFLEQRKREIETTPTPPTEPAPENKNSHIFCNNGFELFNHILNEYVKPNRGRLSDIHFFYWSMFDNKPQLIHQRPERFKEWFFENYNEDLGKIKTYKEVDSPDRQKHYTNALNWFKLQNQ